ncbi:hypothetical protein GCM10022403_084710 [Streptomyces coacervatus]|uniref:GntR C-terminal domain-containing protein n=1 Tax=Streptomyces coacervatus TaxID=647381 RepID=A0ABP7JBG5_9ACTN
MALELEAHPLLDLTGGTQWFLTATVPEPAAQLRRRALEQFPVPMALFDQDGLAVSVNSARETAMGRPASVLVGRRVGESGRGLRRLPGFEGLDDAVVRVLNTGEPMPYEAWLRAPGEPREHAWLVSLSPLRDDAGEVRDLCLAAMDSTEQFLARRRLSVLNESSVRIGSTLDVARTAEELAEVCTDHFADFVIVDLLNSALAGEEEVPLPGAGPLVFRRTAQRSVLEGCVGRTPVREALKRLQYERLITTYPRRGTFATEVNITDLAHISEVRQELEPLAAAQAARRATAANRATLTAVLRELESVEPRHYAAAELMLLDLHVHRSIYAATHNPYLEDTLVHYGNLATRIWCLFVDRLPDMAGHVGEHGPLIEAIVAGDPDKAAQLARGHVDGFERAIRDAI